jgi:uncharacterized protein (DUF433 family)
MVAAASNFLGLGMYTPAEAAMYARITTRTMARWVHGDKTGAAAIRPQAAGDAGRTVTFLDFVQSLAIRAILSRREPEGRVSLQKIRQAVESAAAHGVEYPFARQHATYLFDDQIHIDVPGSGLYQASGRGRGQQVARPIVEEYLADLTFDPTGLADQYVADESRDVRIVMRPAYHFGEPFVESCGVTAWTLWESVHSEGGVEQAARAHGVTPDEVRVAYRYIDSIRPASAA